MASIAVFAQPAKNKSVSVILHSRRVPVPMADDNVNRPACELSDVLENDDLQQFTINTKFLQPGEALPVVEPSGEIDVRMTIPLRELQRRPAHAKPDFNRLSGPKNGT